MRTDDIADSGLHRLFKYLSHVKRYPTSLRAASVVSGVEEEVIEGIINSIPWIGYKVENGKIHNTIEKLNSTA